MGLNMSGISGAWFSSIDRKTMKILERVFIESQRTVTSKSTTGISYIQDGMIKTIKRAGSAEEFFENYDLTDCINEDNGLYLIGHTRHLTSDLRDNQPISNDNFSVVQSGVISPVSRDNWMYPTKTSTDGELILKSFEIGSHPFIDFPESTMAVCTLDAEKKTLNAFRNHEIPLWYTITTEGIIFTSTRDI
jgi:glutamine phosphoribosylpyrophosphate amidotransferase